MRSIVSTISSNSELPNPSGRPENDHFSVPTSIDLRRPLTQPFGVQIMDFLSREGSMFEDFVAEKIDREIDLFRPARRGDTVDRIN